jgi:hypothetical protein
MALRRSPRHIDPMATWSEGKDDLPCGKCGAVHVVPYRDYPEKDRGVVHCRADGCDGIVIAWKGTRDYSDERARLKDAPDA